MKKDKPENKPSLSEVRRAAAMRSVEVRRRMNPKVETTSITCERADSKRVRAISDAENITMKEAVTLCVDAYEDAQRDK